MKPKDEHEPIRPIEPFLNDCTPFNLIGLGVENVPMTYRGLAIAFAIVSALTVGFFAVVHYWR